ncbi:MAG: hypothetical protein R3Y46_07205 [Opitutales bacterium]
MKKITTISLLFAFAAAFAGGVDDINNLNSADVNLAQNARIVALQGDGAEEVLLKAFTSEQNQLAKDGIIYSLANIKSAKAFNSIVDLAKKGDKTAILALAQYGEKAVGILKGLAPKNKDAQVALVLATSTFPDYIVPSIEDFNKADENAKVDMLRLMPIDNKALGFLAKIDCSSERISLAVMTAYAKIGGNEAAKKIMQIQADKNLDISPSSTALSILASCEKADGALIAGIKAGNLYAIKATKEQRLASAEEALLSQAKAADANVKKEALEALATCGNTKSMAFFVDNIASSGGDIALYVKVATSVYKTLNEADVAKYKALLENQASTSGAKVKSAIERIITEPKPAAKAKK